MDDVQTVDLRAPFPWFGGKARVAEMCWRRFGDTPNYVEPFAGSLAVLLGRPGWPWPEEDAIRTETVNDKDCYLANFWRALQADPDAVAHWADWPVNEADLQARHTWLVTVAAEHVERCKTDPDYYDAKIAGWWVWGISQWIGGGWCESLHRKLPHLGGGMGVHRKLPHLGGWRGVHRQIPHLGAGMGVHRKIPHLGEGRGGLMAYMCGLAERLRRVRVCCGDWARVMGPSPTFKIGTTAVFLDPPYTAEAGRDNAIYREEDLSVGHAVREWALANGENRELRIALCGYEGEHAMPADWECVAWKAKGGYAMLGNKKGRENKHRERVWFSPHCLRPTDSNAQRSLFDADDRS